MKTGDRFRVVTEFGPYERGMVLMVTRTMVLPTSGEMVLFLNECLGGLNLRAESYLVTGGEMASAIAYGSIEGPRGGRL